MASRPREQHSNYRDLRERTKRKEHRREENLKRIVELYRARYLHSFQGETVAGGAGDIRISV